MTEQREHLHLLNVLKIMILISISILHSNEFVFWTDEFPHGVSSPLWYYICYFARLFSLGGQQLITIVYFLFGYSRKSPKALAKISLFALLGQVLLNLVLLEAEWDIYAYIAVTNVLILAVPFFYRFHVMTLLFSFLMLWIPTSFFQNLLPPTPFWVIFTGIIRSYNSASWPLLPWFFLALMNYQLGLYVREKRSQFESWNKFESILWPLLFLLSFPGLGYYYWTPMGPNFYNFNFNGPPWYFWANMLPFIFSIRAALLNSVQGKLRTLSFVRWLGQLYWIRHLGLTYLVSIIYLGMGHHLQETFREHPVVFDIFFIAILPVSEVVSRAIAKGFKTALQ